MATFRHVIGKSTLVEGMAVPRELEEWIRAPVAGEKRDITLLFENGVTKATLRRIANARGHVQIKYYQDFIKFMLAFNRKAAQVGVLVVPTEAFARTLCEVGRKKAVAKGRHSYSGMIHIEKVRRELDYLAFMLSMPLAIAGIGVHESRP